MTYTCPVCGFPELRDPPENYNICPCCGTEFELDDDDRSRNELREAWIDQGAEWFSTHTPPPLGWNPARQLSHAGMLKSALLRATFRGPMKDNVEIRIVARKGDDNKPLHYLQGVA